MGRLERYLSVFLVIIIAASCMLIIRTTTAQSTPTPTAPEFTAKIFTTSGGLMGLQTEIKNQPIIPNGHEGAGIFFDRRIKWHESTNWCHSEPDPSKWRRQYFDQIGTTGVTTTVWSAYGYEDILGKTTSYQLDIQYRAINGYLNHSVPFVPPIGVDPNDAPVVVVNTSGWSETVTVTLPKPVTTQTTLPSVPDLKIVFVNRSYDVPPTAITTTNPYTGDKVVDTKEGYHIQNDSFVVSLKSQPPTVNEVDGHHIDLYFVLQSKGHYATDWESLTFLTSTMAYLPAYEGIAKKIMQLSSNNGTTYIGEGGDNNYDYDGYVKGQYGGKVDFRAMAVFGYVTYIRDEPNAFNIRDPYHSEIVVVKSSDWTNTQTISIPDSSVSHSTPNPSPTVPELPSVLVVSLLGVIFLFTILVKKKNAPS